MLENYYVIIMRVIAIRIKTELKALLIKKHGVTATMTEVLAQPKKRSTLKLDKA